MKDNLDKHIDLKIKNSFDSLQEKAPNHLWDSISQQMDKEPSLDDLLDEKVQESYHQNAPKTAPAFLWDSIASELDNEPPIDDAIDEKLKQSFDQQVDKKAPVALWGAISNELEAPSSTPGNLDAILDNKVKTSFDQQEENKTPDSVWFAINRQLNIDNTWTKISQVLDNSPVVSDWRKRMFQFISAAALLLLFLKTCDFNPNHFEAPKDLVYVQQTQDKKEHSSILSTPKTSETVLSNSTNTNNKQIPASSQAIVSANTPTAQKLSSTKKTNDKTSSNNHASTIAPQEAHSNTTNNGLIPPTVPANNSEKEPPAVSKKIIDKDGNDKSNIDNNNKEKVLITTEEETQNEATTAPTSSVLPLWLTPVDALAPNTENTNPIQLLDDIELTNKVKKNPIAGKLEAGAFIVVNSTMLLNKDTREGFSQNSLIQNYFGVAANYGLWASYRIIPKGSIVAEFSINADNRQAYGVFDQGKYYLKEWIMKYNRVSVAYKHDFWNSNSDKLVNTKVVGQAGLYLGILREAKLFYDGDLRFDALHDHHRFDIGFKVAIGQEILIDKFVIGYGLRSDIGAANIFKGNATLSAQENPTNVIHLGGYLTFGYRF